MLVSWLFMQNNAKRNVGYKNSVFLFVFWSLICDIQLLLFVSLYIIYKLQYWIQQYKMLEGCASSAYDLINLLGKMYFIY